MKNTFEPKHRVFIDTEFTDFKNSQMISIGLVSDTGAELYLETTFPHNECSDFVKEVVLPLLSQTPEVMVTTNEIRDRLVTWLDSIRRDDENIYVCFDYVTDWALFGEALDYRLPDYVVGKPIGPNHFSRKEAEEWMHQQGLPRHHALYDARSNKFAFDSQKNRAVK